MKSISTSVFAAAALLVASLVSADPIPEAMPMPTTSGLNAMTSEGCFSSSTGLTFENRYIYQTSGYCQPICVDKGYSVLAVTNSTDCWCGNEMPPKSSLVDDSYCNDGCAGYGTEDCGAKDAKYFTVYLSGTTDDVDYADSDDSSTTTSATSSTSATATTSAKPSVVTVGGETITVVASSSAETSSSSDSSSGGGTNTVAIAVGVVVGVVAIAAIIGGVFFFMRHKRRREVEEEYRRNAVVNSFVNSGKPSSSGQSDFSDSRLDAAAVAQRRMSDGSIADNEDYSRRILKVINV